jgi:hypothetical protein
MRVNSARRFLLRTVQTLTILLTLTAAQSVRSQTTNPPKTPDAKGAPAGNQSGGQTGAGQTSSGQTQTGQTGTGQTPTGQTQTGQTQTGQTQTKPADKPAALCRSPQQEHDYQLAQAELKGILADADLLRQGIHDMEETARDLTNKIAHYDKVIGGKEELYDEEKADHIVPAAAKVDTQAQLDEQKRDIDDEKKKLETKYTEAGPVQAKITAFEKLAPCPKPPKTAEPQPPEKPVQQGTPAVAGGCNNSTDAENLKEYQRLIAFYEKENTDIDGQLKKLDSDIDETQGNKEMEAGLKQGRLDEFKARKVSLEERKNNNQGTIDKFKALVKAILEKKPCPPEEKKISKPDTPGTGTPTRQTDKGRKDDDRKMTKKKTSTGKTVRRVPSDGTTSDDVRRSDDFSRAIGTGIDIGIGIGLGRGGEGYNDRGGRSREMSPRTMPRD